jgi:hypothetical protein
MAHTACLVCMVSTVSGCRKNAHFKRQHNITITAHTNLRFKIVSSSLLPRKQELKNTFQSFPVFRGLSHKPHEKKKNDNLIKTLNELTKPRGCTV